jgi:hypothetical protein
VTFRQRAGFVGVAGGSLGNKSAARGIFAVSSNNRAAKGDRAMGDDTLLLDYARRYFTQAGQSSDAKKMKMLVELGLEILRLAQQDGEARTRAGARAESADTAAPAPKDEARKDEADN